MAEARAKVIQKVKDDVARLEAEGMTLEKLNNMSQQQLRFYTTKNHIVRGINKFRKADYLREIPLSKFWGDNVAVSFPLDEGKPLPQKSKEVLKKRIQELEEKINILSETENINPDLEDMVVSSAQKEEPIISEQIVETPEKKKYMKLVFYK